MLRMIAIAAVDSNWGIGYKNKLLYHIPEDLAQFKRHTERQIVVMGRRTLQSLPGKTPLPNRHNVVLSKTLGSMDCVFVCSSISNLAKLLSTHTLFQTKTVWVIGGGKIYKEMLPYCQAAYLTRITNMVKPADTYFPVLNTYTDWELNGVSTSYTSTVENTTYTFQYEQWNNSSPTTLAYP